MSADGPQLILASGSPRRKELISLLGLSWRVEVADVDESIINEADPTESVLRTAELKASAVAASIETRDEYKNSIILAADTTVILDGQKLNKPRDREHAITMLQVLRGRVHQVYTGIVIVDRSSDRLIRDVTCVDVPMRNYSDDEIYNYVNTGDPLDKAGAYAIQHPRFQPVLELTGCYAAVVGLPLCHVSRALSQIGLTVPADVPGGCQRHHQYNCPVFSSILGY